MINKNQERNRWHRNAINKNKYELVEGKNVSM